MTDAIVSRRSSAGRRDRRRWCGGRVGVEHVLVTRYPPNLASWVTQRRSALCGPSVHYLWSRQRWTCHHAVMCAACGRIVREYLGVDCPDYDPVAVAAMLADARRNDTDAAGHGGDPVEHWPRSWVVVPVDTRSAAARAFIPDALHDESATDPDVELWFPDGCTCGAPTPCRLADANGGAPTGSATDALTS